MLQPIVCHLQASSTFSIETFVSWQIMLALVSSPVLGHSPRGMSWADAPQQFHYGASREEEQPGTNSWCTIRYWQWHIQPQTFSRLSRPTPGQSVMGVPLVANPPTNPSMWAAHASMTRKRCSHGRVFQTLSAAMHQKRHDRKHSCTVTVLADSVCAFVHAAACAWLGLSTP